MRLSGPRPGLTTSQKILADPGNRTRDLWICNQKVYPLDHRGGLSVHHILQNYFSNSLCYHQPSTHHDIFHNKLLVALIFWWSRIPSFSLVLHDTPRVVRFVIFQATKGINVQILSVGHNNLIFSV
jgi:hypothetical protein